MKLNIVINHWQYHKPSGNKELKIDFKQLNKLSLKNGPTVAKAKYNLNHILFCQIRIRVTLANKIMSW